MDQFHKEPQNLLISFKYLSGPGCVGAPIPGKGPALVATGREKSCRQDSQCSSRYGKRKICWRQRVLARHGKYNFFYSTGSFSSAILPKKRVKFNKKLICNKASYLIFRKMIMNIVDLTLSDFNCFFNGLEPFSIV